MRECGVADDSERCQQCGWARCAGEDRRTLLSILRRAGDGKERLSWEGGQVYIYSFFRDRLVSWHFVAELEMPVIQMHLLDCNDVWWTCNAAGNLFYILSQWICFRCGDCKRGKMYIARFARDEKAIPFAFLALNR